MAGDIKYKFLPWARRGLSKAIDSEQLDKGQPLPQRAKISVGITVRADDVNIANAPVNLSLYGPGDVLGIDPQLIVRTMPVANATDAEPNYFAGIEFDPPDFVWMFTPAKADPNNHHRLRPWLVLIVVDRAIVGTPKVQRGRPLPILTISSDVVTQELPDLSESWAWAHTQMTTDSSTNALAEELDQKPNLNVSRLLCPRRLKPNGQYVACLVPAFDAGVKRGRGELPESGQESDAEGQPSVPKLKPAWDVNAPADMKLPVYYHWEFATGPQGDFQSLASKLKPFESPADIGTTPMYIGDAIPTIPLLEPDEEHATLYMEGALRAPAADSSSLVDVPTEIQNGLRSLLNTPAEQLASGTSDATRVLGPPIYGQWHRNQHSLPADLENWLTELNLDPRTRVAAGLGAEIVRKYQEEFMQKCWEQVDGVIKANNELGFGALSCQASRKVYERHYRVLPLDRFLQMTAPVHARARFNSSASTEEPQKRTIWDLVGSTSMPTALVDASFRRSTSPQRALIKRTVRRIESEGRQLEEEFNKAKRSALVTKMAAGDLAVDPTRYLPDGITHSVLLEKIVNGQVSAVAGMTISKDAAQQLQQQSATLAQRDFQESPLQLRLRESIETVGLITNAQVDNLRILHEPVRDQPPPSINIHAAIGGMLDTVAQNATAHGVLASISADGGRLQMASLSVARDDDGYTVQQDSDSSSTAIGKLVFSSDHDDDMISAVLARLPSGTFLVANPTINVDTEEQQAVIESEDITDSLSVSIGGLGGASHHLLVGSINWGQFTGSISGGGVVDPGIGGGGVIDPGIGGGGVVDPGIGGGGVVDPGIGGGGVVDPGIGGGGVIDPGIGTGAVGPADPGDRGRSVGSARQASRDLFSATNTIPLPIKNTQVIGRFQEVMSALIDGQKWNKPVAGGELKPCPLDESSESVQERISPEKTVPLRIEQMVNLQTGDLWSGANKAVIVTETKDRIMVPPKLPAPMYKYLSDFSQSFFCPGVGQVPPNSITLLETNPRFIESFMVGLNYEMNRELLWREYPTDQRGTPFQHFWDRPDGKTDILPIDKWGSGTLGDNIPSEGGDKGAIVLLIRGELVLRYPNLVMLAWKANSTGNDLIKSPTPEETRLPIFQGKLEPDVVFAGFDLTDNELTDDELTDNGGWYFLIQEQPTEPRFGFDVDNSIEIEPPTVWENTSGKNSAHLAALALQKPFRIAIHARDLLEQE